MNKLQFEVRSNDVGGGDWETIPTRSHLANYIKKKRKLGGIGSIFRTGPHEYQADGTFFTTWIRPRA